MAIDLKDIIKGENQDPVKSGLSFKDIIKTEVAKSEGGTNIQMGQYGVGESKYDIGITPENVGNLNEIRAQQQSSVAKLGAGLVNAVATTALDIIKDSSYLLDIENYTDFHKSSEEGFNNFIATAMQNTEDALKIPVYRTKASEGFSPLSAGFWGENMPSILSTVAMAIPAGAAIKGLGAIGKAFKGEELVSKIAKAANISSDVITSSLKGVSSAVISRQMEALMEGGQTFEETYKKAIEAGKTEEEAKEIGGKAAASNYQLNWAALIQDIPEYMMLHKTFKQSSKAFSANGIKEAAKIAGIEGSEEAYQYVTNKESSRSALIDGNVLPQDNTSFSDRMIEYSKDGEFWTSAFLGALGGAGFGLYDVHKDNKRQQGFDGLLGAHKAILTGDKDSYYRSQDGVIDSTISDNIANGTLANFKSGLEAIKSNPERIKDDERPEILKRTEDALKRIEYAEEIGNEIMNNKSLTPELKKQTFFVKLNQRSSETRLEDINSRISTLQSKDQAAMGEFNPEIVAYKQSKLSFEGLSKIPQMAKKALELFKSIDSIANHIVSYYPDKYKSVDDLNKSLISSNDSDLRKLYTNKALELSILEQAKELVHSVSTPEGIAKAQKVYDDSKKKEEVKKTAEEQRKSDAQLKSTSKEKAPENVKADAIKISEIEAQKKAELKPLIEARVRAEMSNDSKAYTEAKEAIKAVEAKYATTAPVEKPVVIKDAVVNESPEVINKTVIDDDSTSRKASDIHKSTTGLDDGTNESRDLFYRTVESLTNNELTGLKLLVVTKNTNPELYASILANDPTAGEFERTSPDYNGIWTIIANEDGSPYLVNGKYIQSTLETSARVLHPEEGIEASGAVDVARGIEDNDKAIEAREKAIGSIKSLRDQINALTQGDVKYLKINGRSKGLLFSEGHSAFEEKVGGDRASKSVVGRIFKSITNWSSVPLELAVLSPEWKGVKIQKGKLYTQGENGRVFDLTPRLINSSEQELVLSLILEHLNGKDKTKGFDAIDEVKKIISFKANPDDTRFQMFIKNGELYFNDKKLTLAQLQSEQGFNDFADFLDTKRVNVNNKYMSGEAFTAPSLNGKGKKVNYKEYLLSGEAPMFGTDLKQFETEGKPTKRFIQTYLTYDPLLISDTKLESNSKIESAVIADNITPVKRDTEEFIEPAVKPTRQKRSKDDRKLDRLKSIAQNKAKLTQEEKAWFKSQFPNVPLELIQGLIDGQALGQFTSAGWVLLSDEATAGTLYHEAFHVVTQLYLKREETDKLYAEATVLNEGKTRKELEEILAEDYADYKSTGKILKNAPVRNTIFRRLTTILRDFFGMSAKDVQHIYERLDKGFYTNKAIVGEREFSSLNRSTEAKRVTTEKGTAFVKDVLDSLDVMFFHAIYDGGKTPVAIFSNVEKITDWIHDDFIQLEESTTNPLLLENYSYILDNFDSIINIWKDRLNSNGIEFTVKEALKEDGTQEVTGDESIVVEENNTARSGDAYQEGNLTSSLESVSSPIRMLLMSLKAVDKNNEVILNSLGLASTVDFKSTYTYLLKNTVGLGSSYDALYNKIKELSVSKPEFKQLLEIIGEPSAILDDDHMRFQTQFLQAFNKTRTNSLITTYDTLGNIRIIDANRQNEADKVKTIWENNLIEHVTRKENGDMLVDMRILDIKNNLDFLSKLGITFDDNTVAIVNSKEFNEKELNDAVAAIKAFITHHKGVINELYVQVKDSKSDSDEAKAVKAENKKFSVVGGRMMYLMNLEAKHTSLVNELSFISADGKTEYSVGENNGLSITTNIINNSTSKDDLFSKLPHLNTIGAEGSLWLNQMFDESTGERNKGVDIKLELHNGINTSIDYEDGINQSTRKGTKGDLITQQIASILNGKSSYIVSSDKSQEFVLSLNYYDGNKNIPIPIKSFEHNFINVKLQDIFKGYFESEVKRISKFELDGLGSDVDIYKSNGGKWTLLEHVVKSNIKTALKKELESLKEAGLSYDEAEVQIKELLEPLTDEFNLNIVEFFNEYYNQFSNILKSNKINGKLGFPADLTKEYTVEQLIRTVIVTDFINSAEQIKLFVGDQAFYKDLYKRTSMFAGTKQLPRLDDNYNVWLNSTHPRKDGKLADGYENTVVYNDVKTEKQDIADWIAAYVEKGFSEDEAYGILGYEKDSDGAYKGFSAYGSSDEGDAMGWGSLDFIMEFHRRLGTNTPLMESAYTIMQGQEFDDNGVLIAGELLTSDQIAMFQTLKLQYAGPINAKTSEIYIPGGYKFTVMPLIPQMIAGKNLSKTLKNMQEHNSGISLFKSGSKFGTIVDKKSGKANKFYEGNNSGLVNSGELTTQSISYQYLGLQVKPSEPHDTGIFSTQFRKTILINAFNNGEQSFEGAKDLLDQFNSLIEERTSNDRDKLIKDLGIDPESREIKDVTELVNILTKASEDRKLTDNIIDSLDIEEVDGVKKLKYSISAMVNKPKIDSILISLINSRIIKQKFNGDAYVLAPVTGMESIGERNSGTNNTLRGYTRDAKTGKTLPAQVMVPLSKNYKPLLDKYGSLEGVNKAIKAGLINDNVLELVGCRIPGQGMNSNEYLIIAEFLPEDSATTMIAHPDIVAKAGSDFDNDKLYTYRPTLNDKGQYVGGDVDNKIIDVVKQFISHESNFTALITPNSTIIITPLVDEIKYTKYLNKKTSEGKKAMSFNDYIQTQKTLSSNIYYTDNLKLHKKIEARYKLWLAKDEVGPAAIANAFGPLSQIAGLTANKSYVNENGSKVDVSINLPHNEINGLLNMSSVEDANPVVESKNNISEINNQLINIIVDAAKDEEPMVTHLNMTMETLPIYLYLNRLGVPFEYVANFMVQPVISDYLEANNANKSVFLKVTGKNEAFGVKKEVKSKYSSTLSKEVLGNIPNTELSLTDLKKYQLVENRVGKEFDLFQMQVFRDFLAYQEQSSLFGEAVRVTNADSAGLGQNINASRLKLQANAKVDKAAFINNIDKVINNTFVKSFNQDKFVIETYRSLYDTQREDIVEKILSIANRIEQKQIAAFKGKMSKNDKIKLINTIENDFINYVTQNYGYKNISVVRDSLFKGSKSIPKQLLALKNKKPSESTSDELKLKENVLIKQLFPLIDIAKPGDNYDNIRIYSKRIATFESNQLTEAFHEIKSINSDLAGKIMHLGILQSGLNNSHITYLGIIPFEYYNELVKKAFSEFNKKNGAVDLAKFEQLFNLNRRGKIGYGAYGKDFDANKANDFLDKEPTSPVVPVKPVEPIVPGINNESNESIAFDEAKPSDMKQTEEFINHTGGYADTFKAQPSTSVNEVRNKLQESEKKTILNAKVPGPVKMKKPQEETAKSLINAEVNRLGIGIYKSRLFDNQLVDLKRRISMLNNKNKREGVNLVYTVENTKSAGGSLFSYEVHKHLGTLNVEAKIARATPEGGEASSKVIELEPLKEAPSNQLDLFSEMSKVSDKDVNERNKECE